MYHPTIDVPIHVKPSSSMAPAWPNSLWFPVNFRQFPFRFSMISSDFLQLLVRCLLIFHKFIDFSTPMDPVRNLQHLQDSHRIGLGLCLRLGLAGSWTRPIMAHQNMGALMTLPHYLLVRFTQKMDRNGGCWDYHKIYYGSFPHSLRLAPVRLTLASFPQVSKKKKHESLIAGYIWIYSWLEYALKIYWNLNFMVKSLIFLMVPAT